MPKTPTGGEMSWILDDSEKKKKKRAQELKTEEQAKLLKSQKVKEKVRKSSEANQELTNLKDLVEKWVVSKQAVKDAKKAAEETTMDNEETRDILQKIDEIQANAYMKKYVPNNLFVSKEEYRKAIKDPTQRAKTLGKVDDVLWILAQHINPTSRVGINIFSAFALFLVDKDLIQAQEHHIDIKFSLKK